MSFDPGFDLLMMTKKIVLFSGLAVCLLGWAVRTNGGQEVGAVRADAQHGVDWLSQAKQAEGARDFSRAAECYVQYLKADPQNAEVHQRLGLVYYLSNRFQDAVPPLQRALKLGPKQWGSALFLGICYYRLGQFPKALEPLREALRINADLPEGYFWLGSTLFALGQTEEAIAHLQKVAKDSPVSLEADSLLVKAYREAAESYYRRIEKVDADSYRVHQLQAESFAWKDRNLEAIEEYRKALAREPRLEGVHRTIGDLYWQKGELELARKEYESEISLTPLDDKAHLRLGQYWLAKRELDRAAPHLELAARVNKNSSEVHRDLAQVWMALGDTAQAESLLKTAAQQRPEDALTHQLLAELYRRTNRPDLASQELELFSQLSSVNRREVESSAGETGKSDGTAEH